MTVPTNIFVILFIVWFPLESFEIFNKCRLQDRQKLKVLMSQGELQFKTDFYNGHVAFVFFPKLTLGILILS